VSFGMGWSDARHLGPWLLSRAGFFHGQLALLKLFRPWSLLTRAWPELPNGVCRRQCRLGQKELTGDLGPFGCGQLHG